MKIEWNRDDITFTYCTEEDIKDIASMLSKDSVCKYLFFGPNDEEDTTAYFSPLVKSIDKSLKDGRIPDIHIFTIREKDSDAFVGQCALLPIEFTNGNYLIGYQLDDMQWRKGYGSSACEFLVYYAFDVIDAFRITGDCVAENTASEMTMVRSGFKMDGMQKGYWFNDGKLHDRLLFALLKTDVTEERMEQLRNLYK